MVHVEFYFDLSSPWTCLTFNNIQPIIQETGTNIVYKPFLVGGVFNAVNKSVYAGRDDPNNPKMKFFLKSLRDWAEWSEVPMNFPSPYHPVKSVNAMRFCCALEEDQSALFRFIKAAFEAYFTDQRNLDDPEVLIAIANEVGLGGVALAEQLQSDVVKTKLRENTRQVIDRGGFGSPSIFVNETDMYFGNDQLPLVKRAIKLASD
ncbi:2-hydroxychromene-2-carboxylate isomerase [hydrothermal vent metagenome]|uniref:2-hydroxychromene-2-carboxylate isomerase n=1 Tax=hydrothermal vent metagenome TaxID=652676 RepID=A0A3B0RJY4_9ZZZZ